ncbi:Fic family protein [Aureibaculum sp. 2210JD6-5]|uniref:Fic family protein n=1 Tax=Aureibaculum sp. 2210JD6-5 TaxID=3103957 RepID=UPI002AAE4C94|nr:Fic family protein [Aureibaculum sp. 2210JD6-5]MDY7395521.1 Fic family protein [Aureibaculum sp. 2210JD6-5]
MNYNTVNIQTINKLKLELDKLIPFSKENQNRLQKKIRLEFNYNSNHLEGNTLTYGQTQLLLFFDKSSGDVPVSDIEEMKAHDAALFQIIEMANDDERPLSESFIRELNETILVKSFWKDAISPNSEVTRKKIEIGQYKKSPNSVQLKNGEIHEYASPEETPALMRDLLNWYQEKSKKLHPVHLAGEFHYRFVCIHPFDDGNGRVARLLMNYILLKHNYPMVIIKSEDKENYLTSLQKADTGDLLSMIEYVEKQSIASLELSIKAGKGENIDELGDIEKQIEILKREKLTQTKIFKTPKVSYDLIKHIDNDFWNPLNNILEKFSDFFAETTNEVHINHLKYKKTRTITPSIMRTARMFADKEVEVKQYEIFGKDLAEEEIDNIRWTKKMLSLKSATKKMDYEVSCSLNLDESSYNLKVIKSNYSDGNGIMKNKTILFEIENEYKSYFMNDIIDNILKGVSNHLITIIQNEK